MAHWRKAFPGACPRWVALPRVARLQAGLGLPLGAVPENGLPSSPACTPQDFGPPCSLGTEAATTPSRTPCLLAELRPAFAAPLGPAGGPLPVWSPCLDYPFLTSVGPGAVSLPPGGPPGGCPLASSSAALAALSVSLVLRSTSTLWPGQTPRQFTRVSGLTQCLRTGDRQPQARAPGPQVQPHLKRPLGEGARPGGVATACFSHQHRSPLHLVVSNWQDSGSFPPCLREPHWCPSCLLCPGLCPTLPPS